MDLGRRCRTVFSLDVGIGKGCEKGQIDGDFRTDETEMLVLQTDGTVRRTEQTVKTWLKYDAMIDRVREKYRSGLSADEILRSIRASTDNPLWS